MIQHSRQSGYTLLELLMTMGIGVIIASSIWSAYASHKVITDADGQSSTVRALFKSADSAYALSIEFATTDTTGTRNPISLDQVVAATSGELPQGLSSSVSGGVATYSNLWGGAVSMTAESSDGGATLDLLKIETKGIPESQCRRMLENLSPFVYDTRVNGSLVKLDLDPGADVNHRTNLNFKQAYPLCVASNTMDFRRLKELNLSALRRIKPYTQTLTPEEQGLGPACPSQDHCIYDQAFLPNYTRLQAALAAREAAQQGIP